MKKKNSLFITVLLFAAAVLWTAAVSVVNVQPAGPDNSNIGFATLNLFMHNLTGVNLWLYIITDWLSIIPLCIVLGFAATGLLQWIKRKSIFKVDSDIILLGIFYLAVLAVYLFFETVIINYRPVLIGGVLERSYPSSTTMLVMCVMTTAAMQVNRKIKDVKQRKILLILIFIFTSFMLIARLVSGVHWITDIIGGVLFSAALVMMYHYLCCFCSK